MKKDCSCGTTWVDAACPIHGALIIGRFNPNSRDRNPFPDELFLRTSKPHPPLLTSGNTPVIQELLWAIIDRAYIGCSIAILEDETDNFMFIVQLAQEALKQL
jgi:hypothetical protein